MSRKQTDISKKKGKKQGEECIYFKSWTVDFILGKGK